MRWSPRPETSTLKPDLLSLLRHWVSPIWYTSNTVPLRDEVLALTVVAWLPFFFAVYSDYDVLGSVSCSFGQRTSIILYAVVRASGFPRVHGHRPLEVCKRPWSLRGSRGYAPHGTMGLMDWFCRLLCAVHQTLSLGPCTVSVNGAAGHNRWGVMEFRIPEKFFPMNVAAFIVAAMNIRQIIECSSPEPATFDIIFCLFRT